MADDTRRPIAPGFTERLHALLTCKRLPPIHVNLATYRRLRAMQERLIADDPTLSTESDGGFEHVIYAAICGGLHESEADAGVKFDENTGRPITSDSEALATMDADGLGVTITGPLRAKVVLMKPDGTEIYEHEPRALSPGDTLSWEYPADGLRIVCS